MTIHSEAGELPKLQPISLGTLFMVKSNGIETTRVDIVLDIGEKDGDFESSKIYRDGNKLYFGLGGSRGPEDFGRKVGQLSLQEVINAAQLDAEKKDIVFTETMHNILLKYAKKGTRNLEIRR